MKTFQDVIYSKYCFSKIKYRFLLVLSCLVLFQVEALAADYYATFFQSQILHFRSLTMLVIPLIQIKHQKSVTIQQLRKSQTFPLMKLKTLLIPLMQFQVKVPRPVILSQLKKNLTPLLMIPKMLAILSKQIWQLILLKVIIVSQKTLVAQWHSTMFSRCPIQVQW